MITGKKYNVGIYLRLSRDDKDEKEESASISNQRDYLMKYIRENDNLILIDEYIDDGISGKVLDRPEFIRMHSDVENGKINCIIVKDLSRYGRNDLVNYHIKTVFPLKRCRFISLGDNYDSENKNSSHKVLGFTTTMNTMYCEDISEKVKSTIYTKKANGEHLGGQAPYGYKKDPNNKYHLVIDEEVAPIVRRMFEMFASGNSLNMIAKTFDKEQIPIPSEYKKLNRGLKSSMYGHWQTRTIDEMLKNETYIGNLCQCRRKRVAVSEKYIVRTPKEEWIIVKNTHEPIVDEETFNIVQNIYEKNSHLTKNTHQFLLKGFLTCKECGHTIGINVNGNGKGYCVCNYYRKYSKQNACTPHSIPYLDLESKVLREVKKLCKKINTYSIENNLKKNDRIEKKIRQLEVENKKLSDNITQAQIKDENAYMDKISGLITSETYNNIRNRILEEKEKDKLKLEDNIKQIIDLKQNNINKDHKKIVDDYVSFKKPNRKILSQIIDKILIDENLNIDIYYKIKAPI